MNWLGRRFCQMPLLATLEKIIQHVFQLVAFLFVFIGRGRLLAGLIAACIGAEKAPQNAAEWTV